MLPQAVSSQTYVTNSNPHVLRCPYLCILLQVPKSIDNDVMLVDKTFGFDTVVQEVVTRPLLAAKVEAASARKGVGLVKVGVSALLGLCHLKCVGGREQVATRRRCKGLTAISRRNCWAIVMVVCVVMSVCWFAPWAMFGSSRGDLGPDPCK